MWRSLLLIAVLACGLAFPAQARAAASLTINPITWGVVGLDSNDTTVGQNHFPVGARVCNTSSASTTAVSNFIWDDGLGYYTGDTGPNADPAINLRPGTLKQVTLTLAPASTAGDCQDVYFEVEVARNPASYDRTRRFHITSTDNSGTVSTPIPREIYVERLVSQSRNTVSDMQLSTDGSSYTSVASGGSMTLVVGKTYWVRLIGSTATNGYEQIESFINFPNTIFQVLSTATTYTAGTTPTDTLYGDACTWEANPASLNYRSCLGTGKQGGGVTVTYKIKILTAPGAPLVNPEPLGILIYDFSGSSYHYNSDYSVSVRYGYAVDPAAVAIAKNFSPDPTNLNGVSALTFTLTNPYGVTLNNASFTDTFPTSPGAMVVANPTGAATSSCGSPTFAPAAGAATISFSNGTIPPNGSCTVQVNVTVPATGTYDNSSANLLLDGIDTGNMATDSLVVNTNPPPPACTGGVQLARWNMETAAGTGAPPAYTAKSSKVSAATASYSGTGASAIDTANGNAVNSWSVTGGWDSGPTGYPNAGAAPYFDVTVDTSQATSVAIVFDYHVFGNWAAKANNYTYVYSSADGGGFASIQTLTGYDKNDAWATSTPVNASATGTGTTSFRINAVGQQSGTAQYDLDNIILTGCVVLDPPTILKAFSPATVAINGTSTLTFTLANPNLDAGMDLTGVTFTDALPAGLQVAATPNASTTCSGTPTWSPAAGATTLTFGTPSGATINANSSCTVSVSVTATTAGPHQNISGFVSSTNGGTNTASSGYASANLTAIVPPNIEKLFDENRIASGTSSTLTFTLTNPNQNDTLASVTFTDVFPVSPGAMTVAAPLTTTNTCGGAALQDSAGGVLAAGDVGIRLPGGSIVGGATCTVTVNVTATPTGTYTNTSGAVSAATVGGADTATAALTVYALNPRISIGKQVGPSATGPWSDTLGISAGSNVYYKFTVENIGDVAFTSFNVTDPTLQALGFGNPITCAWSTPNSPTTLPGLPVGTAAVDPTATCVIGPTTALTGTNTNTATAQGTYPTGTANSSPNSAVYKTTSLSIVKSVTETSFGNTGDLLHYSYLVTNDGFDSLAGPVTVTDNKVSSTCPNVNTVGNNDSYLDPSEQITCTATYTVTAGDVTTKSVTNEAFAAASGVNSPVDTEIVFYLPTRVFLSSFRAIEEQGRVVVVWETASEVNTVGFFLWRLDPTTGRAEQLNRQLLPAMLSPPAGGVYRLIDDGAFPGSTYRYRLEEVESTGDRNTYGPFEVTVAEEGALADGATVAAANFFPGYRRAAHAVSRMKLARIDAARAVRAAARDGKDRAPGARIAIPVSRDGLYFFETPRFAELLGISVRDAKKALRNANLLLSSGGSAVAYLPAADSSGLYFYGRGASSIYTKENVYWLSPGAGLKMARVGGRMPAAAKPASFADTVHAEENLLLEAYPFIDPESDFWFWEVIFSGYSGYDTKSFTIETPSAARKGSAAALSVSLQGLTDTAADPDHHVRVKVNGVTVGEHRWDGTASQSPRWEFSQQLLRDGANTIEVQGLLDTAAEWSLFAVDSFDLTYQRRYEAAGDALLLRGDGSPTVTVSGFSSPGIIVLDVTDPTLPTLKTAAVVASSGAGYGVSFVPASRDRVYLAAATGAAHRVTGAHAAAAAELSQAGGAEYVVIAPEELREGAQALADYRAQQGLSTLVVDVEEIMNEFNHGLSSPKAIRSFLTRAWESWAIRPRFAVLVGDGTYDYHDNLGFGENLVPTMTVRTRDGLFTSDNVLADVDGDSVPEVAVGRISVLTPEELEGVIDKIAAYERAGGNRVVLVADDPDDGGDFTLDSDTLAGLVPQGYEVSTIYLAELGAAAARRRLLASINEGTNLINYLGHANSDAIAAERILKADDVPSLTNRDLPFVLCGMTCMLGEYGFPGYDSLNELLLLNRGGGAAAVWSSTGLSYNGDAKILDGSFLAAATSRGGGTRLGPAILEAFRDFRTKSSETYLFDLYNLQGDPALLLW